MKCQVQVCALNINTLGFDLEMTKTSTGSRVQYVDAGGRKKNTTMPNTENTLHLWPSAAHRRDVFVFVGIRFTGAPATTTALPSCSTGSIREPMHGWDRLIVCFHPPSSGPARNCDFGGGGGGPWHRSVHYCSPSLSLSPLWLQSKSLFQARTSVLSAGMSLHSSSMIPRASPDQCCFPSLLIHEVYR